MNDIDKEELEYFKKLKADGLLIKIPCKIGTVVYDIGIHKTCVEPLRIIGFAECDDISALRFIVTDGRGKDTVALADFGETWFLTEEKAILKICDRRKMHGIN